ncbi:MAG: helicase HerA domain-containing protein [Desulfobacterales bacterium]
MQSQSFEKLGAFFIGSEYDLARRARTENPVLYDAKDLTTHGVCVGMTGSGKTGLCIALIEEAVIDGIPVIAVDPKGDIGNLMLRFPNLDPADFRPWVDESEAVRQGISPDAFARKTAELWRTGLADWGQDGARIRRLMDSAEVAVYTPGSTAGRPLSVLRSFRVPPASVLQDADAFGAYVQSTVSGLLGLIGVSADPLTSREHILLSTLLSHFWQEGKDLSLADVILGIQKPPFSRIGVFDLEVFFPGGDRMQFALRLNGLMAAPGFQSWMTGEPLNAQDLFYGHGGKPRISILSIAHLSDAERMFFVTLLLNELLSWMRRQPGTPSLRALFYMDEIFGYFPPVQNPPSKLPMMTLLKQARAYGLGMLLATQNPVDLDYKGLSNIGTWFIGRLQTERDKLRLLDGLEGVAAASAAGIDRAGLGSILSSLGSRVFLMHNVHEDAPRVFTTRWVMSYLRGPLTLAQIRTLTSGDEASHAPAPEAHTADPRFVDAKPTVDKPMVATGVPEVYIRRVSEPNEGHRLLYRPVIFADVRARYARAGLGVDEWVRLPLALELDGPDVVHWPSARLLDTGMTEAEGAREEGIAFAELPAGASNPKLVEKWRKDLIGHVYRDRPMELFRCPALKLASQPGEKEDAFRGRLAHKLRETRDLEIEKLRKRYAGRLATVEDRIRRAEQRVERENEQYQAAKTSTVVSLGATVIGALLGRKLTGYRSVSGAGSAVRRAQRAGMEKGDIERAKAELDAQRQKLAELEDEFRAAVADVEADWDPTRLELVPERIPARKSDITVLRFGLAWRPWAVAPEGGMSPLFAA